MPHYFGFSAARPLYRFPKSCWLLWISSRIEPAIDRATARQILELSSRWYQPWRESTEKVNFASYPMVHHQSEARWSIVKKHTAAINKDWRGYIPLGPGVNPEATSWLTYQLVETTKTNCLHRHLLAKVVIERMHLHFGIGQVVEPTTGSMIEGQRAAIVGFEHLMD